MIPKNPGALKKTFLVFDEDFFDFPIVSLQSILIMGSVTHP